MINFIFKFFFDILQILNTKLEIKLNLQVLSL